MTDQPKTYPKPPEVKKPVERPDRLGRIIEYAERVEKVGFREAQEELRRKFDDISPKR